MSVTDAQTNAEAGVAAAAPLASVALDRPSTRRMLADAWHWRHLIPRIGVRVTLKSRSGTILGPGWMVLRPALNMFGMSLVFGGVLATPSQGLPYLVFMLFGTHAWMLFDRAGHWTVRAFDTYRRVARSMYMPLLLIPLAAAVPALLESCVLGSFALLALIGYSIADGHSYLQFGPELLVGLAGYVLSFGLALAMGFWLSALNARARDVRIIFIYVLRIWMFVTPVVYPLSEMHGVFATLAYWNPVTAPVLMVKWGLLGVGSVPAHALIISLTTFVVVGVSGVWFFTKMAPTTLMVQPVMGGDDDDDDM